MAKFDNHPTVRWWREQSTNNPKTSTVALNSDSLRTLCLDAGADDVGFVEIYRPAIANQHAENYVAKHFPNKTVKLVSSGIRPQSIQGFLFGLPLLFQRNRSEGLSAIYHFTFTGSESRRATVTIQNKMVRVQEGHLGKADISDTADSKTWLGFLGKEQNLIWALLRCKIRVSGSLKLLQAFGKCFPG